MKPVVAGVLLAMLMCTACSSEQAEQIIESNDKVVDNMGYDRPEKVISFLKNVEQKEKDEIRVTSLTIEGDPIITEMIFDGELVHFTCDTRQDRFGARKLSEKRCKPVFTKRDAGEFTEYALENCLGTSGAYNVFFLPKET